MEDSLSPTTFSPPDLYVILGGCSRRERAGAAEYVAACSGSGASSSPPPPLWVLSPAQKRVSTYTSAPLCVPAERLRIACASVDTVGNFTEHADEIRRCCGGRGGRVTVFTCPQHVARARAVARVVLGSMGLSVEVVAPAALVPAAEAEAAGDEPVDFEAAVREKYKDDMLRFQEKVLDAVSAQDERQEDRMAEMERRALEAEQKLQALQQQQAEQAQQAQQKAAIPLPSNLAEQPPPPAERSYSAVSAGAAAAATKSAAAAAAAAGGGGGGGGAAAPDLL
eukprot:Rhum_TRINITY_DN14357_c10_g1::Rhum_TRINITY_DN14357_c10_g1_i1::g.84097::m.84097